MTASVFLVLGAVCLMVAQHPFGSYPLSLALLRRHRPSPPQPVHAPPLTLSVCLCAYNEAARVSAQIERLLTARTRHPDLQILVYVDAATDETAAVVQAYGAHIEVHHGSQRRGKTYGMNQLLRHARGEIVVFTDAAVLLDPHALDGLSRWFADPRVGGVCGTVRVHNAAQSAVAGVGALYWRWDDALRQRESALGCVIGAHGPLFAMRRALHRPPPEDLIDDLYLALDLLCQGYKVIHAPDFGVSRASAADARDEYWRKVRIACQAWNVHRALWPALRQLPGLVLYCYVSHKPLRWLSGLTLATGGSLVMVGLSLAGAPAVPALLALGLAAIGLLGLRLKLRPWSSMAAVLAALVANGHGLMHALQGRRYQTWALAASARQAAPVADDTQNSDTV